MLLATTLRMLPDISLPSVTAADPWCTMQLVMVTFSVDRLTRSPSASFPDFEDDGVVAVVEIAIGNPHVLAGIDHDAVGERSRIRLDADIANHGIGRVQQVDRPERRTHNVNALDQDILGFHEADEGGAEGRRGLQILLFRLGRLQFQQFPKVRPHGPKRRLVAAARAA